jgi:hypothetical protein
VSARAFWMASVAVRMTHFVVMLGSGCRLCEKTEMKMGPTIDRQRVSLRVRRACTTSRRLTDAAKACMGRIEKRRQYKISWSDKKPL